MATDGCNKRGVIMADGLFGGAAFGVYPQMQPRRRLQDVQGAANLPVDVLRGRIAGLFGLVPDVLNFMGRSPMPTETFGETQYDPRPQLPYDTDFYLKNFPLAPTSRAGQVAGQAGSFVPLNPAPLVRAGVAGAQALAPTAARMTERYMQRQGLMPGVLPEPPAGLLTPEIPAPKPQAPVSDLGFYSAAEQAAMNLQRGKGSGQSFLNDLMKASDVKKDELQYTGLDEFLKDKPNVTRQEVQDFIAGNRINVQERQLGAAVSEDPIGIAQRKAVFDKYEPQIQALYKDIDSFGYNTPREVTQSTDNRLRALQEMRDAEANAFYKIPEPTPTKYDKFQLPGGENYREILLTLPSYKTLMEEFLNVAGKKYGGNTPRTQWSPEDNAMYEKLLQEERTRPEFEYRSSHFNEPNILAHMRVNDRVDADGKKMLLIEEVQSDWHQAGREKGYQGKGTLKELPDNYFVQEIKTIDGNTMYVVRDNNNPGVVLNKDYNKQSAINGVINELNATSAGGVPDAPFKDTWHQLALKRALKEAVDKGYDRIGLTTGKQQAERYQLSKQISEVHYSGTNFKAYDLDGNEAISRTGVKPEDLAGLIGKEPAKKLLAQPKQGTLQSLTGQNLDVGGEGMKKYYDEIYPAFLEKQGKKYGAKVGETRIKTGRGVPGGEPVRFLDITPEMRKAVQKGQPLFAAAPVGALTASEFDYTDPFGNTIADTTR